MSFAGRLAFRPVAGCTPRGFAVSPTLVAMPPPSEGAPFGWLLAVGRGGVR